MASVERLYNWQERLGVIAAEMAAVDGDAVYRAATQLAYAQTRQAWRNEAADDVAHYEALEVMERDG